VLEGFSAALCTFVVAPVSESMAFEEFYQPICLYLILQVHFVAVSTAGLYEIAGVIQRRYHFDLYQRQRIISTIALRRSMAWYDDLKRLNASTRQWSTRRRFVELQERIGTQMMKMKLKNF
jgi:hypothetical protein